MKFLYTGRLAAALAVLGLVLVTGAPARAQSGAALNAYNADLQLVWDRLGPQAVVFLQNMGTTELQALHHRQGVLEVTVPVVRGIRPRIDQAPGFTGLTPTRVAVQVPLAGTWQLEVEADVRVKLHLGFWRPSVVLPITLIVEDLRAEVAVHIDTTQPDRPELSRVDQPQVQFRVRLRSRNWLLDLLLRLLSPIGDRLAHQALDRALVSLTSGLNSSLSGIPIPGDGAPPFTDSGRPVPLAAVVAGITRKIQRDQLPHGRSVRAIMDVPTQDSWETAYGPNGTGNPGSVVGFHDGGDSPIWTSHFLASQAIRYDLTGDQEALDLVRRMIWGLGTLLDINGGTGLLARETAPLNSMIGQDISRTRGSPVTRFMHGETWIRPEYPKISRDQYMGVFFGLAIAHDLVPDPGVRADCRLRISQMLDYLVSHDWYVDEDRLPANLVTGQGFPTFWTGVGYQKITFSLIADHLFPGGRYGATLAQVSPLAETAWLGAWFGTWNLTSFYKFNLSHGTYYNYFRLETDPVRWQHLNRSFRMTRRYVGHHRNAHFDLIHCSVDPSVRAVYFPQTREVLRRFLERPHRQVGPAVVNTSGIQYHTLTMPQFDLPGQHQHARTVTLPTEPIDIPIQPPAGDWLWQREPFRPVRPNEGDPLTEQPGVDLVLPYWMARYYGGL